MQSAYNRKRSVVVLVAFFVCASTVGGLSGQSSDAAAKEPWQGSWAKFIEEVDRYRQFHIDVPGEDVRGDGSLVTHTAPGLPKVDPVVLIMLALQGGAAAPKGPVARDSYFERAVEFDGFFQGVLSTLSQPQKEAHGEDGMLRFEMPPTLKKAMVYVYPKSSTVLQWKALAPNQSVAFRARCSAVVVNGSRQSQVAAKKSRNSAKRPQSSKEASNSQIFEAEYLVTLVDAEILSPTTPR